MPLSTGVTSTAMRVNARAGLRLRSGPGTDFDVMTLLPFGARVQALRTVADWTQVDIQGDGAADGFVSSSFLVNTAISARSGTSISDAARVPELIRQGSKQDCLAEAEETARRALPGYPSNGCAAHLSALLQQAGIDVEMTLGAGKLAARVEARGWTRIDVGQQQAGDIGVCFDNDPTPAGADHVYLVIEILGPDEMAIADNQKTTLNPEQRRFATGRGRTATEYFLRAI